MSKRRRRRSRGFRGAACTRSSLPRVARGGIGLVAGGLVGGLVGFGAFAYLSANAARAVQQGVDPGTSVVLLPMLLPVLSLGGAATGAFIGARKPNC